jgi:hypothetical protein
MSSYSINDISTDTDRFKLYSLFCNDNELESKISYLKSKNITVVNIGKEIASFISNLKDITYLHIEVYDYIKKLLDNHKSKINGSGNDILALYNMGILLEPYLELNAVQMLKDFSKISALIIIWENSNYNSNVLHWNTQKNNFQFDFSESHLKILQDEI